jgi:hypothetical protein
MCFAWHPTDALLSLRSYQAATKRVPSRHGRDALPAAAFSKLLDVSPTRKKALDCMSTQSLVRISARLERSARRMPEAKHRESPLSRDQNR